MNVMGTWLFRISHAIFGEVWRRRTESDTALPWKLRAILRTIPHGLTEEPGRLGASGDDQDKNKGVAGESSILTSSRRRLEAVFSADGEADVVCSRARENYSVRRGCFPLSAV